MKNEWLISAQTINVSEFYRGYAPIARIPTIQREFVWEEKHIRKLIDSMINNYPIGSIICLEADVNFPSVPLSGNGSKGKRGNLFIIDGQQRLTTLMLMKNDWKIDRGSKSFSTDAISYNPDSGELKKSEKIGINVSLLIKAATGDAKALEEINKRYPGKYEKAFNDVCSRILNYPLPFWVIKIPDIKEDDYMTIAEVFTRINKAGVKISNTEMFLSFFAAAFGKSKERVIEVCDKFNDSFDLDLATSMRFMFSKLGRKQNQMTKPEGFKKAIETIKKDYKEKDILQIVNGTEKSIDTVTCLIQSRFGMEVSDYIPSEIALLPLFDYFYNQGFRNIKDVKQGDQNKMLKWFLISSFEGYYTSRTNERVEKTFELLRGNKNKGFPIKDLLKMMKDDMGIDTINKKWLVKKYNDNDAYSNSGKEYQILLYALLTNVGATNWAGPKIKDHVNTKDNMLAKHHIFPQDFLVRNEIAEPEKINCMANLTFIDSNINTGISDAAPSEYLSGYSDALKQHFIPIDKKLWEVERYDAFLKARANLLSEAVDGLLKDLD